VEKENGGETPEKITGPYARRSKYDRKTWAREHE
jgi:hypothetical protein